MLFKSSRGRSSSGLLIYCISHSKICTSQCTLMSMSSALEFSFSYFSKYFIRLSNTLFSQMKSLLIFLDSSHTWIVIFSCLRLLSSGWFLLEER